MKAIIMRHGNGGSYTVDKEGNFRFVRGVKEKPVGTEINILSQSVASITKIAMVIVCLLLIVSYSSYSLLSSSEAYAVYIDINPSIELIFNRFDKLKEFYPLNSDGGRLLQNIKHHGKVDDLVLEIINEACSEGYLGDREGNTSVLITVTSFTGKYPDKAVNKLLRALNDSGLSEIVEIWECSLEDMERAVSLGVSPGKLKMAETLKALFPSSNLDELLRHSVEELNSAIKGLEESELLQALVAGTAAKEKEDHGDKGISAIPVDKSKDEEKQDNKAVTDIPVTVNRPEGTASGGSSQTSGGGSSGNNGGSGNQGDGHTGNNGGSGNEGDGHTGNNGGDEGNNGNGSVCCGENGCHCHNADSEDNCDNEGCAGEDQVCSACTDDGCECQCCKDGNGGDEETGGGSGNNGNNGNHKGRRHKGNYKGR